MDGCQVISHEEILKYSRLVHIGIHSAFNTTVETFNVHGWMKGEIEEFWN